MIGAVLVRRELEPLERVAATAAAGQPPSRWTAARWSSPNGCRTRDPATEVGQVGAALNHMLDHVGAALEARQDSETQLRQFVADASHELRTPLAAIRGYAELTRRGRALGRGRRTRLSRISSQAERMTTLVEDLLLLARLDAGRPLERTDVDLTRLVLDAVSDAHAAGPDHRWQLDLPDEPVTVTGDASRLHPGAGQPAGQRAHAHAAGHHRHRRAGRRTGTARAGGGRRRARASRPTCCRTSSNGSRAAPRRGPGRTAARGSGLAIVSAVVAAHGGDVSVTSRPGHTEFAVRLPMEPVPVHS